MRNDYLVSLFIGMMMTLLPMMAKAQVSYIDADGDTQSCSSYTSVDAQTTWGGSEVWFVVDQNKTISSRITVNGTVHLILVDGYTLTASSGITVNEGNALTIYGQSEGTGKLVATGYRAQAGIGGGGDGQSGGTITINGGTVTASGGSYAADIGDGFLGCAGSFPRAQTAVR